MSRSSEPTTTESAGANTPSYPAEPSAKLRHALKQPLNHIIGYSELLMEEAPDRPLGEFHGDLLKIHVAAGNLSSLLDTVVLTPKNQTAEGESTIAAETPLQTGLASHVERPNFDAENGGHLLVVDDDPDNCELLSRQLKQRGYRVSIAANGRQALALARSEALDLILLDVLMPDMDGFSTCEELKADSAMADIPVIFMTALADTVDKVKGLQLGAVDYITKPFHQAEVSARIHTHLTLQRLKRRIHESERRLYGVVESAMDPIVALAQTGEIVLFNRAAERAFRCSASDVLGTPVRPLLTESLQQWLDNYVNLDPSEPKLPLRIPEGHAALRADGEAFPVEATIAYAEANGQALYTLIIRDVQERQQLQGLNRYLQDELQASQGMADLIGAETDLREVVDQVQVVAPTAATVLILGETGTGKEVIARTIHALSRRRDKVLVKLNCAAIPKELVESELFGHEKGSFTGAINRKLGRFELADQGTLFLDEVGELPLDIQAKFLRVLQEGEFERVGGCDTRKVDVRIVAATNRDLMEQVQSGRFRADLFYRLNVFPIHLPPLRQRPRDLPLLVQHFVRSYGEKYGKRIDSIPLRAMAALQAHTWPGNARELQHVIERAVILSRGCELAFDETALSTLPTKPEQPEDPETLEEAERAHILKALETVGWRVSGKGGAAERLGLKPSTLEFRMKKLGITRPA